MEDASPPESGASSPPRLRLIVTLIIVIVLISSGLGAWYFFIRNWSIEDVARAVINDPTPAAPGFKHGLAGKSIVVEGKVTNITSHATSLGNLTLIELDHFLDFTLVAWGSPDFSVGETINMRVMFEWSTCNDERHVYSPQLSFPNIMSMLPIEIVTRAVNYVARGLDLVAAQLDNGDIRMDVDYVMDPVPVHDANCTLRTGSHSWAVDYVDVLGEYRTSNISDEMASLSQVQGESGIIRFMDENSDGYIDKGDYFLLRNVSRPSTDAGFRSYLFTVDWPPDPDRSPDSKGHAVGYLPVISKGLLRYERGDTPGVRIVRSSVPSGVEFTVTSIMDFAASWGNLTIALYDNYYASRVEWIPVEQDLKGPPGVGKMYAPVQFGSYSVQLNVTDSTGDGCLDIGDSFSLTTEGNGFSNESSLQFYIMYRPSGGSVVSAGIVQNSTPLARINLEPIESGIKCILGAPHTGSNVTYEPFDVPWQEIAISLSDGNNTVNWTLDSNDLHAGAGGTISLPQASLGSLEVLCNASDIEGNGYINRWDSITITTAGLSRFSPAVTYTVNVTYIPRMSTMSSVLFEAT